MSVAIAIKPDGLTQFISGTGYGVEVNSGQRERSESKKILTWPSAISSEDVSQPKHDELPPISGETSILSLQEISRVQRLNLYISSVRDAGEVNANTADLAWTTWNRLKQDTRKGIPVPDAAPGPDGEFLFSWNKGEHHLEIEIFPASLSEFFYYNRSSDQSCSGVYENDKPVSDVLQEKLSIFIPLHE